MQEKYLDIISLLSYLGLNILCCLQFIKLKYSVLLSSTKCWKPAVFGLIHRKISSEKNITTSRQTCVRIYFLLISLTYINKQRFKVIKDMVL